MNTYKYLQVYSTLLILFLYIKAESESLLV